MHVFVLPGMGLQAEHYSPLVKCLRELGLDTTVLESWPRDVEGVRAIGPPGTRAFRVWLDGIVRQQRDRIAAVTGPKVVFAHSSGSIVASELGHGGVLFGASHRPDTRRFTHVFGVFDSVARIRRDDDEDNPPVAVECGHFGCVDRNGYDHCAELQRCLGLVPADEEYIDAHEELARLIRDHAARHAFEH